MIEFIVVNYIYRHGPSSSRGAAVVSRQSLSSQGAEGGYTFSRKVHTLSVVLFPLLTILLTAELSSQHQTRPDTGLSGRPEQTRASPAATEGDTLRNGRERPQRRHLRASRGPKVSGLGQPLPPPVRTTEQSTLRGWGWAQQWRRWQ